jgi:hypothetical protein
VIVEPHPRETAGLCPRQVDHGHETDKTDCGQAGGLMNYVSLDGLMNYGSLDGLMNYGSLELLHCHNTTVRTGPGRH